MRGKVDVVSYIPRLRLMNGSVQNMTSYFLHQQTLKTNLSDLEIHFIKTQKSINFSHLPHQYNDTCLYNYVIF